MQRADGLIRRRSLLAAALAGPTARREIFLRSPGKGTAVMAYAWYTGARGVAMASLEQRWSRSDTIDVAYRRTSRDNGATWSEPTLELTGEKRPGGMWRKHPRLGWADPATGRYLEFWNEGVLPTDDPLEGLRQWKIYYRLDGVAHQVVVEGGNPVRWLPGVEAGRNCAMLGDQTCRPFPVPGGFLLPVSISPLSPSGELYNPGGGYTYHDAAVLHAAWQGRSLRWRLSKVLKADPARTTRGLPEPTLAMLNGNRLLMVMRGSNDAKPSLPSYRWVSFSEDGGWNWTPPEPWTDSTGKPVLSPSACSQLLPHSSRRLFWLGNLASTNPKGNRPRYPFHLAEVDRDSGQLRAASVRTIDDLVPGEDPILTLSNFFAREDRRTGEIALHMTRLFAHSDGWEGDAMIYRITV